jgi:ABC-type glycerol-3-phosphate transport system permease component
VSEVVLVSVYKSWDDNVAVRDVSFTAVGLAIFAAPESGVDWSIITAGTLLAVAPLLIAFLLFQRQFVQSFMRAGIK